MAVSGKVAIVFGGARGIGEACVERLLREGAKVCIGDIRAELGAATCQKLQTSYPGCVIFVPCDVTDDKQIEDVFNAVTEKFGCVEICVSTAGILDEVNWRKTVQINLLGSMAVTYIAQKHMATNHGHKGGQIILLSSVSGLVAYDKIPAYCASKHGIIGFVRSLGCERGFKQDGVRVNAISPFQVDTELLKEGVCSSRFGTAEQAVPDMKHMSLPIGNVADAMMKLIEEDHNGATLLVSKKGSLNVDDTERDKKLEEWSY